LKNKIKFGEFIEEKLGRPAIKPYIRSICTNSQSNETKLLIGTFGSEIYEIESTEGFDGDKSN